MSTRAAPRGLDAPGQSVHSGLALAPGHLASDPRREAAPVALCAGAGLGTRDSAVCPALRGTDVKGRPRDPSVGPPSPPPTAQPQTSLRRRRARSPCFFLLSGTEAFGKTRSLYSEPAVTPLVPASGSGPPPVSQQVPRPAQLYRRSVLLPPPVSLRAASPTPALVRMLTAPHKHQRVGEAGSAGRGAPGPGSGTESSLAYSLAPSLLPSRLAGCPPHERASFLNPSFLVSSTAAGVALVPARGSRARLRGLRLASPASPPRASWLSAGAWSPPRGWNWGQ